MGTGTPPATPAARVSRNAGEMSMAAAWNALRALRSSEQHTSDRSVIVTTSVPSSTAIDRQRAVLRSPYLLGRGNSSAQRPGQLRILTRVEHGALAAEADVRANDPAARVDAN